MKNEEKTLKGMNDTQKKEFYVTKIARLSSEEYKLNTGIMGGLGVFVISLLTFNTSIGCPFPETVEFGVYLICLYCFGALKYNNIQQLQALDELDKLNNSEGRTL